MAKGIVVVDVQDSCQECSLRTATGYCLAARTDVFMYGLKDSKPDWCPLVLMPEVEDE